MAGTYYLCKVSNEENLLVRFYIWAFKKFKSEESLMKKYIFLILVIFTFSLTGCSSDQPDEVPATPDKEPGLVGYVMVRDNDRILVVDPVPQDFSSTGGVNEFYDAISFSNVPKDIKEGDKVKVWFDAVAESYPGQSEAIKIEVIPSPKPDGADLDESEAINKALNSGEIDTSWPTVVKSIKYNNEIDAWELDIRETIGEQLKTYSINVKDVL